MDNVSDNTLKMTRRSFVERAGQLGAMWYDPLGILAGHTAGNTRKRMPEGNGIFTNVWVDPLAFQTFKKNDIRYIYFDIGDVDKTTGKITTPQDQIGAFVNNLASFEQENNYKFIKLPWNVVIPHEGYRLDLPEFRKNYLDGYVQLVKQFQLDGIHVDIEAIHDGLTEEYLGMLKSWRAKLPEKSILSVYGGSITPDSYENDTIWSWPESFLPTVFDAGADVISIQTYDTDTTNENDYRQYLIGQIELARKCTDGQFRYPIPAHKPWPELSEVAIKEYFEKMLYNCNWPFSGMDLFATWTMTEEDWKAFDKNSNVLDRKRYGIRKELRDLFCSIF